MSDASVMALIAMIGASITLIVQFFDKRDSRRFDARVALLESRSDTCEKENTNLKEEITKLKLVDVRDRAVLQAQINQIDPNAHPPAGTELTPGSTLHKILPPQTP